MQGFGVGAKNCRMFCSNTHFNHSQIHLLFRNMILFNKISLFGLGVMGQKRLKAQFQSSLIFEACSKCWNYFNNVTLKIFCWMTRYYRWGKLYHCTQLETQHGTHYTIRLSNSENPFQEILFKCISDSWGGKLQSKVTKTYRKWDFWCHWQLIRVGLVVFAGMVINQSNQWIPSWEYVPP